MPELPDIVVYIEALRKRIIGETLAHVRIASPFLLRTATPPISSIEGLAVVGIRRIGKRIAIGFEGDRWLVLHLMIAGRLHWREPGAKLAGKNALAAFDFTSGTLVLTEAGTTRRASLHVLDGTDALEDLDPGGLEVTDATCEQFAAKLISENHTLKRALTDPRLFSGIGNSYSDEILFKARLSPVALSQKLTPDEVSRLYDAIRDILNLWTDNLRADSGDDFPEKVTAFRPDMAVHGRYNLPCVICGAPIQRIRYANNETNYCVQCQTHGKLLSDRALSRLLGKDWPRTLEELETLPGRKGR